MNTLSCSSATSTTMLLESCFESAEWTPENQHTPYHRYLPVVVAVSHTGLVRWSQPSPSVSRISLSFSACCRKWFGSAIVDKGTRLGTPTNQCIICLWLCLCKVWTMVSLRGCVLAQYAQNGRSWRIRYRQTCPAQVNVAWVDAVGPCDVCGVVRTGLQSPLVAGSGGLLLRFGLRHRMCMVEHVLEWSLIYCWIDDVMGQWE